MTQPPSETSNNQSGSRAGLTYKDAGVDIEAGARTGATHRTRCEGHAATGNVKRSGRICRHG